MVLPPRSQCAITARLKNRGRGPPELVLIEPGEIDVSGVYAARVVSLVRYSDNNQIESSPADNKLYRVFIKLLTTCSESIKVVKGTVVEIAVELCPLGLVCPGQADVVSERVLAASVVTNIATELISSDGTLGGVVPKVGGNDREKALKVVFSRTPHREISSTTESFCNVQCARWHLLEEINAEEENMGIRSNFNLSINESVDSIYHDKFVRGLINSKLDQKDLKALVWDKLAHLDSKDRSVVFRTIWNFRDVFYDGVTKLGCKSKITHKINTGNAQAIRKYPYRVPYALQPVMKEEINKLLERGVIQPSASPWSAPCL